MGGMRGWVLLSLLAGEAVVQGATSFFLGHEYQAQTATGAAAGTVRGGAPDGDAAFTSWLAAGGVTPAGVMPGLGSGTAAVWGKVTTAQVGVTTLNFSVGNTTVPTTISGWNDATSSEAVSGTAVLSTFGLNGTSLQAGAPRPGFASGAGSGYYIGTDNGAAGDGIRNGVKFDLTGFAGGGVYAFGIFGGDLETGAPGSPAGFLRLTFADNSVETITYAPDATLFGDAVWSPTTGNNTSETYGNETSRFIGIISDDKRITSALFVVGDDDTNDSGDSEHLSFIGGGVTFLDASGNPVVPVIAPAPEPSVAGLAGVVLAVGLGRRRRGVRR